MAKKRVYNFDSFNFKVKEGINNPGFIINEFEEENEQNIDEMGSGESVTDELPDTDQEFETTETVPEVQDQPTEQLDFGDRQDISPDEVKVKISFIQNQLKSYVDLVKNMDNVALDKTTKEKIVKIYNVMQGI